MKLTTDSGLTQIRNELTIEKARLLYSKIADRLVEVGYMPDRKSLREFGAWYVRDGDWTNWTMFALGQLAVAFSKTYRNKGIEGEFCLPGIFDVWTDRKPAGEELRKILKSIGLARR